MLAVLMLVVGCGEAEGPGDGSSSARAEPVRGGQTAFRVRTDAGVALNADTGWAADVNEDAIVTADRPFRIRFELESGGAGDALRLQVRRNNGPWTFVDVADFPYPDSASPRVSIDGVDAYDHGEATTDLLNVSDAPFTSGAGVNRSSTAPFMANGNGHAELEWPVVIRRWADGAVTNEPGDMFEFRMTTGEGRPFRTSVNPVLTLDIPAGHLGGTFVETPGRIGPFQSEDGSLYFIMEPSETDNVLMIVTSDDSGATWYEVDGANRPAADDLEGLAADRIGDTIHILHQQSEHVWHHAFRMDSNTWALTDELLSEPGEPPVQVASITARADGGLVAVYGGPKKLNIRIRSANRTWSDESVVEDMGSGSLSGPVTALGSGEVVHLAYTRMDGTGWLRSIRPDGTLSDAVPLTTELGTQESDVGSILPLGYLAESDEVVVVYRTSDGRLRERRIGPGLEPGPERIVSAMPVVQNAVDSDQAGADLIVDGTDVHVLFISAEDGDVYHVRSTTGAAWSEPEVVVSDVHAQWIRGSRLQRPDGHAVYSFVYDAGSNGGSGMNRYASLELR